MSRTAMRAFSTAGFLLIFAAACGGKATLTRTYPPGSQAQGQPCDYASDCMPPAGNDTTATCVCSGVGSPVCSGYRTVSPGCDGATCTATQTCVFGSTPPYGTCVPSATAGGSCASVNCVPGLFCNESEICEQPRAIGATCIVDDPTSCAQPAYCDAMTAKCTALGNEGQACYISTASTSSPCVSGLNCAYPSEICVAPQLNGASCSSGDDCLSGECPAGTCATGQCTAN